jgi:hypothetical protein
VTATSVEANVVCLLRACGRDPRRKRQNEDLCGLAGKFCTSIPLLTLLSLRSIIDSYSILTVLYKDSDCTHSTLKLKVRNALPKCITKTLLIMRSLLSTTQPDLHIFSLLPFEPLHDQASLRIILPQTKRDARYLRMRTHHRSI